MWPIERLRQAERHAAPPEPREPAAAEQQLARSVPRGGGWRPGARWAREDQLGHVALPPDKGGRSALSPLVTSIRDGNRIVIAAACPQARALGLPPGMALAQARAQVAGLDIRDADPEGDRAHLAGLAIALARRWTPTVAIEGDDTLFLDLSGVAHLHGGEAQMAARLRRMLARLGYTARIAIADTPGAAWALAHYRHPGEGRDPEPREMSLVTLGPGLRRGDDGNAPTPRPRRACRRSRSARYSPAWRACAAA